MSFTPYRDVLPSGLRVVTIETPHLHTALLSVYVRTGSRHETRWWGVGPRAASAATCSGAE